MTDEWNAGGARRRQPWRICAEVVALPRKISTVATKLHPAVGGPDNIEPSVTRGRGYFHEDVASQTNCISLSHFRGCGCRDHNDLAAASCRRRHAGQGARARRRPSIVDWL